MDFALNHPHPAAVLRDDVLPALGACLSDTEPIVRCLAAPLLADVLGGLRSATRSVADFSKIAG